MTDPLDNPFMVEGAPRNAPRAADELPGEYAKAQKAAGKRYAAGSLPRTVASWQRMRPGVGLTMAMLSLTALYTSYRLWGGERRNSRAHVEANEYLREHLSTIPPESRPGAAASTANGSGATGNTS